MKIGNKGRKRPSPGLAEHGGPPLVGPDTLAELGSRAAMRSLPAPAAARLSTATAARLSAAAARYVNAAEPGSIDAGRFETRIDTDAAQRRATRSAFVPPRDGIAVERIIGRSDLVKINFFRFALQAARPVCRIHIRDRLGASVGFGTGSLVAADLLLTNWHVLPDAGTAGQSFAEFDYEEDESFLPRPTQLFAMEPAKLFVTDEDRDFTLVRLASSSRQGRPLQDYGHLRLVEATGKVLADEYVSIIQHPEGNTKHAAVRENRVLFCDEDWMHYATDTQPGSSGSPVFNDQWFVVALHHSGVPRTDDDGRWLKRDGTLFMDGIDDPRDLDWVANEGVRISRIFKALEERAGAEPAAEAALAQLRAAGDGPIGPPVVPGGGTDPGTGPAPATPAGSDTTPLADLRDASGYDPAFLGRDHAWPLPRLSPAQEADLSRLRDGTGVLVYEHFSILMSRSRRLAFVTAVNLDGRQLVEVPRASDRWLYDPRIDRSAQSGEELYAGNPLDRGHLVRRRDPGWGPTAAIANRHTFHFTNAAPQHAELNQKTWLEVEDFILETAAGEGARISVLTGPVFRPDDRLYRGQFQLPADFWKIVGFVDRAGRLRATAYLRTQKNLIDSLREGAGIEFFDDELKTYQVPVSQIAALTGLDFGLPPGADPLAPVGTSSEAAVRRVRLIESTDQIVL